MKILIVEDCDKKAKHVEETVRKCCISDKTHIDRAKSVISAIRQLEGITYDLLLLDLVIPQRDNELATYNCGKHILSEIVKGNTCNKPSHIICLTAFADSAGDIKSEEEKGLVHIIIYSDTDCKWKELLQAKVSYVSDRLEKADYLPTDYDADIAIVTSSPHVELNEVKKLPGDFVAEYNQADCLHYFTANWRARSGKTLKVVSCAAPFMGMTAACATAFKVIDRWRPRYLCMTGIAAGVSKSATYGDILVADSAFDYESGKIIEREDGERTFQPSPNPIPLDSHLHALLQMCERDQLYMNSIQASWYAPLRSTPKMIFGIIASGAAVVQSKNVVNQILGTSRKVVGIDMEAYAIFQAARLARSPIPKVLVAKSVCDFADIKKNDDWQQFAAFTSARFIYEFFTNTTELNMGH